ncbi:hypothetical protein LTR50_001410 [Elasticomyces elasticus]|nr:hypothetical protein LTR50_001410 [Elasticomyces elasticus]
MVSSMITESYKRSRHEDDLNQPLFVQAWGQDAYKLKYYLIEGLEDTHFRVYREEMNAEKPLSDKITSDWRSVAGTIDELKALAEKLQTHNHQLSDRLSGKMTAAIPRFEATAEKIHRREYRRQQRARFTRPEPGFSLYEGRTRGKRLRYTFSEEGDDDSEATSTRRSTRQSGVSTPADNGPTITASGRQVKSRGGGLYGESLLSGTARNTVSPAVVDDLGSEASEPPHNGYTHGGARATRSAGRLALNGSRKRKHIDTYNSVDEMSDEEDATSSGGEWEEGDVNIDDNMVDDQSEEEITEDEEDDPSPRSLIVKLKIRSSKIPSAPSGAAPPLADKQSPPDGNANREAAVNNPNGPRPTTESSDPLTSDHFHSRPKLSPGHILPPPANAPITTQAPPVPPRPAQDPPQHPPILSTYSPSTAPIHAQPTLYSAAPQYHQQSLAMSTQPMHHPPSLQVSQPPTALPPTYGWR